MVTVEEKLAKAGPRKLLAMDGGGIRGVIALQVLGRVERVLQHALGRDDSFALAEYFDYIAGSSTGAIIASALSLGMRVAEIRSFYEQSAVEVFRRTGWRFKIGYRYDDTGLNRVLQEHLGVGTTLGSDRLQTLLLLVMRNASTSSPWPLSNNPHAFFNDHSRPDCNLDLPLWRLVRASAAAPGYFKPESVRVGEQSFVFLDGGLTPYNNPAFHLFLAATLTPYRLCWPAGAERILLVSVGTGMRLVPAAGADMEGLAMLRQMSSLPGALISAEMVEQDLLCRVFGRARVGEPIDAELGDLSAGSPTILKLFSYMRFDADLSREGLDRLGLTDLDPEHVQRLDGIEHIPELEQVGDALAERVGEGLFEGFL
jgi:hypothetical protein